MREKVFDASYISAFCMEMYLIIRAGIPFAEGVALLHDDEPDAQRRTILNQLHQQLELGEPFAASMRAAGGFPVYVVEMVEIGQRTGHLERVFHALAGYYERMDTLQKGIRNALTYPAVLMSMMLVVVFVLLVKVLPIFEEVFHQLGAELSPAAQLLMAVGQFLGRYGLVFLAVLVIGLAAGAVLLRSEERKVAFIAWLLQKSENWEISRLIASSRLADALVLTLSSGMDIDDSLDMAMCLVPGAFMQEKITQCKREMLLENKSFAEASLASGLFAPLYCRMLAVGFRAGAIDSVMEEVARRCAEQVDDKMESMLNRIEPTLVIVMSLLVGLILLSVMLPLMSIMTAIG
jgi:type IV pilus assembly protein PilC